MATLLKASLVFIAFALLHSITASGPFKGLVSRIFGQEATDRYYRLSFNVFSAVITAAAGYAIFSQPDTVLYRPPWYILWPAHAVQVAGMALLIIAFRPFDAGSFLGTRPQAGKVDLTTSGAYGLVRHPMYLAGILVFLFEPNVTVNSLAVRGLATVYFIYGAFMEERRLVTEYGEEYSEYKKRVPMFDIITGIIRRKGRSSCSRKS